MQRQRAEEQRVKAQAKARARRSDLKAVAPNYVALALLLALAASVHGAVFGSILGYIAAFGGLLVGAAVAVLVKRLRVGALMSMVVLFLAYMLFGGALALPQTTLYGVLPTLRTIQMLVVGVLGAWKDLLTVQPPAGVFIGGCCAVYLSAVLAAFLSVTIVLRSSKKLMGGSSGCCAACDRHLVGFTERTCGSRGGYRFRCRLPAVGCVALSEASAGGVSWDC